MGGDGGRKVTGTIYRSAIAKAALAEDEKDESARSGSVVAREEVRQAMEITSVLSSVLDADKGEGEGEGSALALDLYNDCQRSLDRLRERDGGAEGAEGARDLSQAIDLLEGVTKRYERGKESPGKGAILDLPPPNLPVCLPSLAERDLVKSRDRQLQEEAETLKAEALKEIDCKDSV